MFKYAENAIPKVRYTYNAAPHTLASNQLSLFIALAEKLISNLRMQIAK